MVMKLIPYKKALQMGKEAVKASLAKAKAKKAKKQAELEMSSIEEQIASMEIALQEACAEENLSFNRVINLQDNLDLLGRRKEQFQIIINEMFPAEDEEPEVAE